MATLIIAENPGKWRRQCDAKCHMATEPECSCICGGRFHGKGRTPGALEQAVRETSDEFLLHELDDLAHQDEQVSYAGLIELRDALAQETLL